MKKVITFGVFDYFHYGHLKLFERAKELGDYLIVAVQVEEAIKKYKPAAQVMYSTEQRLELISSLRVVDEVVIYSDVDKDIANFDFDVFVKGEDQLHNGFESATQYALSSGREVVVLRRTKGISSSQIKGNVN